MQPPPGDPCRDKGTVLVAADVRGMYDTIRIALTRAALAAEGRPQRTVNVILDPKGAQWCLGGAGGRMRFWTPKMDALRSVEAVYSAAFSTRADALLTRWNALMATLLGEIETQLRDDGFVGEWFVHALGNGPTGMMFADLLALSRLEMATLRRAVTPTNVFQSRAFLRDDEENEDE